MPCAQLRPETQEYSGRLPKCRAGGWGSAREAWVCTHHPTGAPRAGGTGDMAGPFVAPDACERGQAPACDGEGVSPAWGRGLHTGGAPGLSRAPWGLCSPFGGHTGCVNWPERGCRRHSWIEAALGKGLQGYQRGVAAWQVRGAPSPTASPGITRSREAASGPSLAPSGHPNAQAPPPSRSADPAKPVPCLQGWEATPSAEGTSSRGHQPGVKRDTADRAAFVKRPGPSRHLASQWGV